ncbi:iron siderophore ABC transporter, ATP-binding protein [Campylobacter blaseri]|uniref:ABC transporter n=1 Tax=Campylobacter blaseri TaxID=2042961 RepID=A0A2P8R0W5_9BACT|nr:ABC transporter ATP-binding protein [Campylobacter blaseri]PSM52143.1 ABC transporter [Campylobacter blaseri]PSM53909.1 ABC transporter [Campylobacter blaseri]QKF85343.1 iron siderophore ABC transporter, ATP-binding protein [Campylobacter blaseri]
MILECLDLYVKIDKRELLNKINLKFKSGNFYAIVGPNGAGKSTMLKSIINLIDDIKGEIKLDEKSLLELNRVEIAKKVSYMSQFFNASNLSVQGVLALGRRALSNGSLSKGDHLKIEEISNLLNLNEWLDIPVSNLSGGERQKVLIASCLLQEPKILLLDEPISHLDPKNQHEMLELVKKITKEKDMITLVVLHDIHHALHYADSLVMLKKGKILGVKLRQDIKSDDLKELFDMDLTLYEINNHKFVYFGHEHYKKL